LDVIGKRFDFDERLESQLLFIAISIATHSRGLLEIPDNTIQHVNRCSFFYGPSKKRRHPFVGNILVDGHVFGNFHVTINKVR
jgi:hypothetical protein